MTRINAPLIGMALALLLLVPAVSALGDNAGPVSPVGRWKTVDDNTGKPRSFVVIREMSGELQGTIEQLIVDPGEDPAPKCDKCEGSKKDQPVVGMTFLWGLKSEKDRWGGGRILDPENGKVYKSWVRVIDGGKRLEVRGFIGVSVLGRTQYWHKAD
jgi:uncharacterized protein (DUF2147 family)